MSYRRGHVSGGVREQRRGTLAPQHTCDRQGAGVKKYSKRVARLRTRADARALAQIMELREWKMWIANLTLDQQHALSRDRQAPLCLRVQSAHQIYVTQTLLAEGSDRSSHPGWLICNQMATLCELAIPVNVLQAKPATVADKGSFGCGAEKQYLWEAETIHIIVSSDFCQPIVH
eukprot:6174560-Pleurochrysis_carterae.AAC.2